MSIFDGPTRFRTKKHFLLSEQPRRWGFSMTLHWPDRQFETVAAFSTPRFMMPSARQVPYRGNSPDSSALSGSIKMPALKGVTPMMNLVVRRGGRGMPRRGEQAVIFDQSSYPIFDIEGPHALPFMHGYVLTTSMWEQVISSIPSGSTSKGASKQTSLFCA